MLESTQSRGVVYLRVPRPAQLGPESDSLAWQLVDACRSITESEDRLSAVALVGLGPAFCALPPGSAAECDAGAPAWREAVAAVAALAPPTVAALAGDALGPAFDLALACDLRIAEAHAHLGSPEVRLGRIPCAGGTQRLARTVGRGVALRVLLLGESLTAGEALQLGVLHRVAPSGELEIALEQTLDELRRGAPIALAYAKEAIREGSELPLRGGLALEADLAVLLQTTNDRARGMQAFKQRATPEFEGR